MDPITLPEDLTELTDEDIATLRDDIGARAAELSEADDLSEDEIAEIEALAAADEALREEQDGRSQMAVDRSERKEAALSRIGAGRTEEISDEDGEELAKTDDDQVTEVAASTDGEVLTPEVVPSGSGAAGLSNRRPDGAAPKTNSTPAISFAATGFAPDPEGTVYDSPAQVAAAISRKRNSMSHTPAGVSQDYVRLATYHKQFADDLVMSEKADENGVVMKRAAREATALVASGAICAPLDPVWEEITLGEAFEADLEQAIPTVQAPQGGLRFRPYAKPDISGMLAGIGHYTYAAPGQQGALPIGSPTGHNLPTGSVADPATGVGGGAAVPTMGGVTNAPVTVGAGTTGGTAGAIDATNPKPCAQLVCIDEAVCYIEAFSTCLKVDNLQGRVSPQLVEEAQADLAAAYSIAKEAWILGFMDAIATDIAMDMSGVSGRAAGVLFALETAAAGYRKAHLLSSTATVQAFIERSELGGLKLDVAVACGVDDVFAAMAMTEADIANEMRRRNIEPVFYTDPTLAGADITDEADLMALAYGTGATLATVLSGAHTVDVYLGAPGAIIEMDGGTLDLGLVRDSILNGTNDYQIFMEEWLGLCNRGIEVLNLSITTSAAGARAACA